MLISVIIPAFQRPLSLEKLLEALSQQAFPHDKFEVLVVIDGPCAPVERLLESGHFPFPLRWFVQPHQGETAARNFGLRQARAGIILSLDDDVIPCPELLARHYAWHQRGNKFVVIGGVKAAPDSPEKFLAQVADWAPGHFERCSSPGYQLSYQDLPDSNFSIQRKCLLESGGWDESLQGYGGLDDWDLGYRLKKMGLQFQFDGECVVYHRYVKEFSDLLQHARIVGRAQIYCFKKFPEWVSDPAFPQMTAGKWRNRLIFRLARFMPEYFFTFIERKMAPWVRGAGPKRGSRILLYAVKFLRVLFVCRGAWDETVEMEAADVLFTGRKLGC